VKNAIETNIKLQQENAIFGKDINLGAIGFFFHAFTHMR
jgi:hypothetical protein